MKSIAELYKARFGLDKELGGDLPADGAVAEILNRRSHRRYTDAPVSDDLLDTLLACAQPDSSASKITCHACTTPESVTAARAAAAAPPASVAQNSSPRRSLRSASPPATRPTELRGPQRPCPPRATCC